MAEIQTSTWSETAASNNAATPDGWPEGMSYAAVNNCARENMAAIKREWNRAHATATSAGTATAVTLTYTTAPPAYVQGMQFSFVVGTTLGAAATLNVNALGAKTIKRQTLGGLVALTAGDVVAGQLALVQYDTTADAMVLLSSHQSEGPPIGSGMDFWGSTAPARYLFPYGQAVSRTTYAALFAVLSTTYGVGDGSTTFNLPDMRGRTAIAKDNMGGTAASRVTSAVSGVDGTTLGAAGGDQRLHAHTHANTATGTNVAYANAATFFVYPQNAGSGNYIGFGTISSTDTTGAGSSQNLPPGIVCNYIIYAGV